MYTTMEPFPFGRRVLSFSISQRFVYNKGSTQVLLLYPVFFCSFLLHVSTCSFLELARWLSVLTNQLEGFPLLQCTFLCSPNKAEEIEEASSSGTRVFATQLILFLLLLRRGNDDQTPTHPC